MRHQIWYVTAQAENPHGSPFDTKGEALEAANELNDKPVDGSLYVVKPVPPTLDLRVSAGRLIELLHDADATRDITGVPLSIMASEALRKMDALISRLECDRGFNSSGFASLTDGREDIDIPEYERTETEDQTDAGHTLHYASEDADGSGEWSVYAEDYVTVNDAEPIDGSQRLIESGFEEEEAYLRAEQLQRGPRTISRFSRPLGPFGGA